MKKMKINNYILYSIILSYVVVVLYNIAWINSTLIILLILLICICINVFYIKPTETVGSNNEPRNFPHVSVIIPAWNEENIISRTIESVLISTYSNFDIIIVAGGSDNTFKCADYFAKNDSRITVIEQKPLGKSTALNTGLKYAIGEIVILLDADCIVDKNWFKYLVTPIINKEANITIGNFQPFMLSWVSLWYNLNNIYLKIVRNKKNFFGGSKAFEKSVFKDINGLNEKAYSDDYYLSMHLKKKYKIKFIEKSIVQTDIPSTLVQYLQVETRWLRNQLHTAFNSNKGRRKVIFNYFKTIGFTLGLPISIILSVLNIIPYTYIYIWVSCFFFMMLLNISKPIYVYRYTSDKIYLKYIWVALYFPIIDYILGLYALITYKKVTLFFKGPRNF